MTPAEQPVLAPLFRHVTVRWDNLSVFFRGDLSSLMDFMHGGCVVTYLPMRSEVNGTWSHSRHMYVRDFHSETAVQILIFYEDVDLPWTIPRRHRPRILP